MLDAIMAAIFTITGSSLGTVTLLNAPYGAELSLFVSGAMFLMSIVAFVSFGIQVQRKLSHPVVRDSQT